MMNSYNLSINTFINHNSTEIKNALFKVLIQAFQNKYNLFKSPLSYDDWLRKECIEIDKKVKRQYPHLDKYSMYYVITHYENFLFFDLEILIYLLFLLDFKIKLYV